MNRQQALNQLRIMQAWHEDFGNGPCPDYDAICYAIGVIEEAPEELDTLVKALEAEHKKLREMQKALKNVPDMNVGDTISRQAALDIFDDYNVAVENGQIEAYSHDRKRLCDLPPAQPEIIRCKDCKHWTQSTGKMTGYGLGRCDFHDADLVACNGFCYWAERRTDEAD